ncbi:hypothetical protein FIBSPDRAFT_946220 [Athelia psychrophila]|uniref:Uncharacterized protein n=1 Tax=Athelia psychrophila TaxID=1759441 RepID=A0A166T2C9_9AGAM|nr:hypothetical protein FIBSPDRAFT_946220 [Fibularhizoctonia sp. CBS 109695]
MYNRSRRILVLLSFFFAAEIVVVVLNAMHNIPHMTFTPTCFTVLDPSSVVYYATAILATQVVIGVLTLYKKVFGGRAAWGRTPLSQLVMRDGTTSFAVILGLIVVEVIYVATQNDVAFTLIYWFLPLLSVIGCRLILNLQKLNRPKEETELSEFTTFRSF